MLGVAKTYDLFIGDYGSMFESIDVNKPAEINDLIWNPFEENTTYFAPSEKEYIRNYRVQNIEGLGRNHRENGVAIVDEIETYDYRKFVHIMDSDGNKIELWEPITPDKCQNGREDHELSFDQLIF